MKGSIVLKRKGYISTVHDDKKKTAAKYWKKIVVLFWNNARET